MRGGSSTNGNAEASKHGTGMDRQRSNSDSCKEEPRSGGGHAGHDKEFGNPAENPVAHDPPTDGSKETHGESERATSTDGRSHDGMGSDEDNSQV